MKSPVVEPLSANVRALLASERSVAPQPDDLRRRALLRARAALAATRTPARTSPLAGWRWALAGAGLVAVGTLATAAIETRARHAAAVVVEDAPSAVAPHVAAPALEAPVTPLEPGPARDEMRTPRAAANAPRVTARAAGYALELELLQPARAALARADFAAALVAVAAHERRFPKGQLAEEREALRVLALSGAHRTDEARRAAAVFRERFPRSLLLARMNEALGGPP